MFPYIVLEMTCLCSKFLIILLSFAFEYPVSCSICFCHVSPFGAFLIMSTTFCSSSINFGSSSFGFFFFFSFLIFGCFLIVNQAVVVAASIIVSIVVIIQAIGSPTTFLAMTDICSSWPCCFQYSMIRCPSEYTSFVSGDM